ncbi:MAG: hypothetical protein ABIG08_02455 [bacterium]
MSYPIIIFGAGATKDYDCEGIKAFEPPLNEGIFDIKIIMKLLGIKEKQLHYGEVSRLLEELKTKDPKYDTVEKKLKKIKEEAKTNNGSHKKVPLIFLEFRLKDCFLKISEKCRENSKRNNYKVLISSIEKYIKDPEVLYLTLNYDTLLDESLGIVSISDNNYAKSLVDEDCYLDKKLIKAHGSCDWGYCLRKTKESLNQSGREFTAFHPELSNIFDDIYGDPLKKREIIRTISHEIQNVEGEHIQYVPAIGLPIEKKKLICPDIHKEELLKAFNSTDRILIIGWRGVDDDIREIMSKEIKKPVKTLIVSGGKEDADVVKQNLATINKLDCETTAHTFSTFVSDEKNIENFLKG